MTAACVIFDMDGVLVDTAPFHIEAWKIFGERHNRPVSEEFFYKTFGMVNQEIIPLLFGAEMSIEESRPFMDEKEAVFRDCIKGKIAPIRGVMELVEDLHANGIATAVASSAPRENVDLLTAELGLDRYAKIRLCGDDVTRGKPDPQIFLKAAELCGVPPAACLVVEDAVVGVEAANAAGMASLAVTTTCERDALAAADLVVDSLQEMDAGAALALIRKNDGASEGKEPPDA